LEFYSTGCLQWGVRCRTFNCNDSSSKKAKAQTWQEQSGSVITHSQSSGTGWRTTIKHEHVRAIVAYETGSNLIFRKAKCLLPGQALTAGWKLL
jgi:hypothetical protein